MLNAWKCTCMQEGILTSKNDLDVTFPGIQNYLGFNHYTKIFLYSLTELCHETAKS